GRGRRRHHGSAGSDRRSVSRDEHARGQRAGDRDPDRGVRRLIEGRTPTPSPQVRSVRTSGKRPVH
ncbi:hypothetical protein, partial [Dietzia natronolimnaea]|uniref:hypothetical protein n=1 Tax=Dietzia natronolimnaea TaxID=161920 RepID=UPI0019D649A8